MSYESTWEYQEQILLNIFCVQQSFCSIFPDYSGFSLGKFHYKSFFLCYLAMLVVLASTSLVCRWVKMIFEASIFKKYKISSSLNFIICFKFSCCIKKEDKYLAQWKMKKQKKYYLIHLNASDFNLVVYNMIICYKNHKQNKLW